MAEPSRQDRLAAALRRNLRRRKIVERQEQASPEPDPRMEPVEQANSPRPPAAI